MTVPAGLAAVGLSTQSQAAVPEVCAFHCPNRAGFISGNAAAILAQEF